MIKKRPEASLSPKIDDITCYRMASLIPAVLV